MNIIKLQDQLKGIPDQALVGYVQNPTGEVPTYLALGELQRRKTMREKYQQQKTPQTTVAEDLAAPPPPMEQGIASVAPQQMAAQQPMPEQAPVEMAEGGLAELDVGDSELEPRVYGYCFYNGKPIPDFLYCPFYVN